ncbi:hypothetical protein NX059_002793 [Plenodomus lindquistii]|nr:hypothetical protein NX059_002793 [Plenodomus lindquistii]
MLKSNLEFRTRQPRQPYGFGPATPSQDLAFPAHANMTAAELLTFLPHSIRNADIIYRLVSNGGTRHLLSVIVNTQRLLLMPWSDNTCGATMYKAMNAAGFHNWTVTVHGNWHDKEKATWNEGNLDVGGCRSLSQINGSGSVAPDVPFRSLKVDVRYMPVGYDALDLTRMVQYCVRKSAEVWMYPRDYAALLEHLGGPTTVTSQHHDRAVFKRWADVQLPVPNSILASQGGQTRQRKESTEAHEKAPNRETPSKIAQSALANRSKQTTPAIESEPRTDVRPARRSRKLVGTGEDMNKDVDRDTGNMDNKTYSRPAPKYVAPPETAAEPPHSAIEFTYRREGMAEEGNAFSPYAFGGPRYAPPYRSLRHIGQPHRDDIGGWAENLRWASEQRICFSQHPQAEAWNESPEHMELIAKIRQEEGWASDELITRIGQEQYEEEQELKSRGGTE